MRTHAGSDPSTFNNLLTWRPPVTLKGDEPRLAGGPGGVHIIYRPYANGGASQPYVVRRFNGVHFLKPIIKLTTDASDHYRDLFEDDSGRLHAAWVHHAATDDQLTYRFSTDHRNFFSPQVIATEAGGHIQNVGLSSADDGGGFAAYSTEFDGNSTTRLAPFGTAEKRTLIDVGIAGMDVTQGIQNPNFAVRGGDLSTRAVLPYTGVDLADHCKTVVRVYATSRRPLSGSAVPPMQLFGFHNGNALGGGALLPDALPTSLPVGPPNLIMPAERTSTTLVYTFTLPWQWADGAVNLVAQINPGKPAAGDRRVPSVSQRHHPSEGRELLFGDLAMLEIDARDHAVRASGLRAEPAQRLGEDRTATGRSAKRGRPTTMGRSTGSASTRAFPPRTA